MENFKCLNCGKDFKGYKKRKYCSCKCYGESIDKFEKYVGKKIGKLTILYADNSTSSVAKKYYCKCDCGNIKSISMSCIVNGRIRSCGCLQKEMNKIVKPNLRHGKCNSRIYKIWLKMKNRCYNKNYFQYYLWGGKGIKICDEWIDKEQGFINFYNWAINNGYKDNLSIDRIDGEKNYEPSNCRWATQKEQARNIKNNVNITYNGETHCIAEWAEITGIKGGTLYWRYKNWKDINKILGKN